MTKSQKKSAATYSTAGASMTKMVLEIFRVNGRMISVGDDMVRDLGLTSARWQVMGAIAVTPYDLTVSSIARLMGLQRQSVQRVVDVLCADALLELVPNLHHKTAPIVKLTGEGQRRYEATMQRQIVWANDLGRQLSEYDLDVIVEFLRALRARLGDEGPPLLP